MEVHYCDLCGQPVAKKRFYIVVVHDEDFQKGANSYRQAPASKETYEIDEGCYQLLVKIFDLKKSKIAEIKKFLDETYKMPVNRKTKSKSRRGRGLRKR